MPPSHTSWRFHSALRWMLCCAVLAGLPLLVGCQGCGGNAPEDGGDGGPSNEQAAAKPFEFDKLAALPDLEDPLNQAKPGHWAAGHRRITANDEDFQGYLYGKVLDGNNRPIRTELTHHYLTTERPISLSMGSPKDVEVMFYIPRRLDRENVIVTLEQEMFDRSGRKVEVPNGAVNLMPRYRYFFIVLSNNPGRYSYLKTLTATNLQTDTGKLEMYRVVTPTIESYVPVPTDSSAWTSFAYLLWDNLSPEQLDPDQQQALVDWLHFGGQIIVSGPDAMDQLRGSFLDEYLPANNGGAQEISSDDLANFNNYWTVPAKIVESPPLQVSDRTQLVSVDLQLRPDAEWMEGANGLVAERAVGRGRVVVTAFSLTERILLSWPSFDSFVHNALMRRPRRQFLTYEDERYSTDKPFSFRDYLGEELNPLFASSVRYLSRDLGVPTEEQERGAVQMNVPTMPEESLGKTAEEIAELEPWRWNGWATSAYSGVAGWNDDSAVANTTRGLIDDASGIKPPSSKFVLWGLVIYLVALVPVNWLVFRMIGRVEWAWIAAPIMAIVAAVWIVRMARLDIGFARSQTEVNVVELQNGYARAHVTRYSSLYSSLSTEFEVDFASDDARGQPWGSPMRREDISADSYDEVRLSRSGGLKLTDVQVRSNSAEMLHLEQMIDVGGPIDLSVGSDGEVQLNNRSELAIQDVGLVQRDEQGRLSLNWVGELEPNDAKVVVWENGSTALFDQWYSNPTTRSRELQLKNWLDDLDSDRDGYLSFDEMKKHPDYQTMWNSWFAEANTNRRGRKAAEREGLNSRELRLFLRRIDAGELYLGELFDLVTTQMLAPGSAILIGWTEDRLSGATLTPQPSQVQSRTLVVAHLTEPQFGPTQPDQNLYREAVKQIEAEPIPGSNEEDFGGDGNAPEIFRPEEDQPDDDQNQAPASLRP